jgi:hypothetical protein
VAEKEINDHRYPKKDYFELEFCNENEEQIKEDHRKVKYSKKTVNNIIKIRRLNKSLRSNR